MSSLAPIFLYAERCVGCTRCMQRCPVEAIRIRNGKAVIEDRRCIACGECIRVCPEHAMKGRADSLNDVLGKYKYTVALPAPSFYGQFPDVETRAPIIGALLKLGFDDVFEVAAAAEVVSASTHYELLRGSIPHPIITTACPVILRLVRIRFPSLLPHLLNYRSPTEIGGRWARALAVKQTGLPPEDIGCVLISPCPAKYASSKSPLFIPNSSLSAVVSMEEVVPRVMPLLKRFDDQEKFAHSSSVGVNWSFSGGQAEATREENYLAASGMENIIHILEALEDGKLSDLDLVELDACYPGCVGGPMTVENPFIAKARIHRIARKIGPALPMGECPMNDMQWEDSLSPNPVMKLDDDIGKAMEKLERINTLTKTFRGINCGACGAPTCRAHAEDIVAGRASYQGCIFFSEPISKD